MKPETSAVRTGIAADREFGAVIPPLHLSTTFTFAGLGRPRRYDYTRSGNPTRDLLAGALADLEGGAGAVVTATGMAAVHLALQLLRPGELVVAPHDCYGGTFRLLRAWSERGGPTVVFEDLTTHDGLAAALARKPRLLWIETPSNPLLRITDLREAIRLARQADTLVVVDNTFLSPVLQQPLLLGADVVVHSTTKYLNGHSDVVGGAVVARDPSIHEELTWWANCLGLTASPFDCWLTVRGLRTAHARVTAQVASAGALARLLAAHPAVERIWYPGLESHQGHAIAKAQQRGYGAMVSFELRGDAGAREAFVGGLGLFTLAESLGGVESLIAHPATMTHASMTPEARRTAGITEQLFRLSVGLEATEDLAADLDRALRLGAEAGGRCEEQSLEQSVLPALGGE